MGTYVLAGVWDEFLKIAREEAGSRVVETWFKAVLFNRWDAKANSVYLQAPNSFVKDWIRNNYLTLVQLHLGRLLNVEMPKIIFTDPVSVEPHEAANNHNAVFLPATPVAAQTYKNVPSKVPELRAAGHLNPNYRFDNFVVGPNNSLSYAAAHAITEKPGQLYNPLLVYGGSGLGKTHLLHAIGNEIKQKNKNFSILYQPADRFVNEFISAIRFDKIHKFQSKYKDIDVLLIDDIQFISNKEQTQEAFFHIFNTLHDARKQIVFSSDMIPQNMQGLAQRLKSRLCWGLVTDLYMPQLETKIAILKKKAEQNGNDVCDEVINFIAARPVSNIRELEGALVRVVAFSCLTKQPITIELARKVLFRSWQEQSMRTVDFDRIVNHINKYYACDLPGLQSKSRNKNLTFARQVTMFLMKKLTDKSLRDIGIFLGHRDHSTVMHAIQKIQMSMTQDKDLHLKLKQLEEEIIG